MHLLVNLAENGHHGCDMKCPFCEWSKQDYGKYWFPSDEELDKALTLSPIVVLSGGGDPLYHFEQNRNKVKHAIDYLYEHGGQPRIYSHNLKILWQYREELCSWPCDFIFSISLHFSELEQKIVEFYASKKKISSISTVFNQDLNPPDWDAIEKFIQTFKPFSHICFREHWVYHYPDRAQVEEWRAKLRSYRCSFMQSNHYLNFPVMFEGHITSCGFIDKTVLGIEK